MHKHVSFYGFNIHLWSTLQCLTVSQSICCCCDRGGMWWMWGTNSHPLPCARHIPGLRVSSASWNWTAIVTFQGYGRILFKFVSCARRPLFTNLMMILVSLVASHFHQTTKTRTTAVSGRHLAHELAGLYRFLAIVHQQVQGLAGCKTVNQVWQLACMLCLPWLWQVIRSSISNIRWSMINQWTTYIFQFNPVQAKTHIEQKQVSSVLVRPHALLWASCGCNVLVNDEP